MRWPWQKREPEKRSTAQGYTASLTAAFEGAAVAGTESAPLATAALEAAAGLYSRCLAAAVVKGDPYVQAALTPPVLALIARNLIRRGEDHHLIRVRGGRLELTPQGFTYAHGASRGPGDLDLQRDRIRARPSRCIERCRPLPCFTADTALTPAGRGLAWPHGRGPARPGPRSRR